MIVPMSKVYVAAAATQKDALLNALRDLGVMHIIPVDAEAAAPDEKVAHKIELFKLAEHILEAHKPRGTKPPKLSPDEAVEEIHKIMRRSNERTNRLNSLHRHLEQIEIWGDTKLADLSALDKAGYKAAFYTIDTADISKVTAPCVQNLKAIDKERSLIAVIETENATELPESAQLLERPKNDRPAILAESAKIDQALKADKAELDALSVYHDEIRDELASLIEHEKYSEASRSGIDSDEIFAIQGWVPESHAKTLVADLEKAGVSAATHAMEPAEDELPPTLIEYPKWTNPIKALFAILGTKPGYREYDLSPFFMIAMPIFTAMLIGDAGYGLLFVLAGLLFYNKLKRATGSTAGGQLILLFGIATTIWGVLTVNYFGVGMQQFAAWQGFTDPNLALSDFKMQGYPGFWGAVAEFCNATGLLWRQDTKAAQDLVMQISFSLGCLHLIVAHVRQFVGMFPDQKAYAELGWCSFCAGIFGVIWQMFFKGSPFGHATVTLGLLIAGAALIILFASPSKNPVKRIGFGILGNLMPFINTFGDTMSYIRLMAVGMSSYYIASAFNSLAGDMCAGGSVALLIVASIILVLAHSLNIALCMLAIFAHGVRLNMLEFSTNAGVEWSGRPYQPFAKLNPQPAKA